jgi:hypothetical protein
MLSFSPKRGDPVICDNMDEPGGYFVKLNKQDPGRQILHICTYL